VTDLTRRHLLSAAGGALGLATLAACSRTGSTTTGSATSPGASAIANAEATRRSAGQTVVSAHLTAKQTTLDLGGPTVKTWAYGDAAPGPLIRAKAGDLIRVTVDNQLPAETSVHWHGVALRNDMDGVPDITQPPIAAGGSFTYEFTAPDPGTYFYHPHSGVQIDRGLYGRLIIDDPAEKGDHDVEWIVVLDDWVDGMGRTPDQILAEFMRASGASGGGMGGMGGMGGGSSSGSMDGMDMGGMGEGATSPILGGAGDIVYPHYLANGRIPAAPVTLTSKPKQKARIRLINAASDTAFRVALAGHRLTVTHADGFPVTPTVTDALIIAMGERCDVQVTLADGVFPLVALAEGKEGEALALVRTGAGRAPVPPVRPVELDRHVLLGNSLTPADSARLAARTLDRTHILTLAGSMMPYRWTINGKTFPDADPLPVRQGERVQLRFSNRSMMFHPMHLHGHTFALTDSGLRKDTVIVRPMQTVSVDLDADNPGQWMTHCHNIYHAERGMMTTLTYQ
jgi:FtsP/CotA-like multicopper oxidase with cupredoxin domain